MTERLLLLWVLSNILELWDVAGKLQYIYGSFLEPGLKVKPIFHIFLIFHGFFLCLL